MPFSISIATLTLLQAVLVALPGARPAGWAESLRSRWWAVVPAASIIVVIGVVEVTPSSARALTYLALVACPPLAAFALGRLLRGSRPSWALAVIPLFGLAWAAEGSLTGQASAAAISSLACVTLGWLLASAVPGPWLRWGIYAMATVDAIYVGGEILQGPNAVLVAAHPVAELPRLQVIAFGSARMGFGDVFVAATTGCLLATEHRRQLTAAGLAAAIGLSFDLLFFVLDTLPATVPVAVALALTQKLMPEAPRRSGGI
ncbi:MAG TPA: hypothetical protein VH476_07685 [Solirubrobacterales bacterium]